MLLQITNFPSHFFSLGHRESHSFIPHPHCYVHGAQVCHQMCFLKAHVSAPVDAGTAGPHSRILPITPSLQVAREVSPLEHRSSSHSWLPLQALLRPSVTRFWFPKRCWASSLGTLLYGSTSSRSLLNSPIIMGDSEPCCKCRSPFSLAGLLSDPLLLPDCSFSFNKAVAYANVSWAEMVRWKVFPVEVSLETLLCGVQ